MAKEIKHINDTVSDLPEGFKMTELGPLPEEWEVVRLGEVIEEVKERNKSNFKYPVFTISNIHGFVLSDDFFDKQVYSKNLSTYKIVRSGYFAYNPYRVNVGSLALFDEEMGLVSPAYVVFKISKPHYLYTVFLYRLLKSSRYLDEIERISMSRGSVRRSLSFRDLSDFFIPLPSLSEQKAIAYVLQTVQRAKEATEKVIQATQELKKSLMRHLFTYGPVPVDEVDKVQLKETEIGLVPEHWEVVRVGEVAEINMGQSPPSKTYNTRGEGMPFLQGKAEFRDTSPKPVKYTTKPIKIAKPGSVLLSVRAPVGDVNLADTYYCIGRGLSSLYFKLGVGCNQFLYYYLMFDKSKIEELGYGSTFKAISKTQIANFPIPLPPLSEQREIAHMLQVVDQKIQAEKAKKQALETLFQVLLYHLITGKLRVKDIIFHEIKEE